MANPMEQFVIKPIIPLEVGGVDISFTNSSLFMVISVVVSTLLFAFSLKKVALIPSKRQMIGESLYGFVAWIVKENAGSNGLKHLPFVLSIFLYVAFGNLLGLTPYSFTYTSHIAAVGTLSLLALFFNMFVGIKHKGFSYFRIFMPQGIPWPLAPLVVPIEVISLLSKPFSLTVRLVANMTVGHIMLKVLAGFVAILGLAGIVPILFVSFIIIFEIFIALVQAYIYTVLSSIYLSDAINGH